MYAVTACSAVPQELADWNARYEAKFGHIFIICASGKSAKEMLDAVKGRCGSAMHLLALSWPNDDDRWPVRAMGLPAASHRRLCQRFCVPSTAAITSTVSLRRRGSDCHRTVVLHDRKRLRSARRQHMTGGYCLRVLLRRMPASMPTLWQRACCRSRSPETTAIS